MASFFSGGRLFQVAWRAAFFHFWTTLMERTERRKSSAVEYFIESSAPAGGVRGVEMGHIGVNISGFALWIIICRPSGGAVCGTDGPLFDFGRGRDNPWNWKAVAWFGASIYSGSPSIPDHFFFVVVVRFCVQQEKIPHWSISELFCVAWLTVPAGRGGGCSIVLTPGLLFRWCGKF